MKNTIHLSSETTISYHYKPERDELSVQLRPATGTVHAESVSHWEHVQLQREQPSGEVVGFTISSVQQVLLEQLVRNLTTSLEPHFVAAPQSVAIEPEDATSEPVIEETPAMEDEFIPAGEAGETHILVASVADFLATESETSEGTVEPTPPAVEADPTPKKSRSRRRKGKKEAQPEAIAELEAILSVDVEESVPADTATESEASPADEMGVELIEMVAKTDTPTEESPEPVVTPEPVAEEVVPAPKKSRSRRGKGESGKPKAETTPVENTEPAVAETIPAEAVVEIPLEDRPLPDSLEGRETESTPVELVAEDTSKVASKSRSRRRKKSEPVVESPAPGGIAEAVSIELSPTLETLPISEAVAENGESEADREEEESDSEGDADSESEPQAIVAGESGKKKRRKRRKRRSGNNTGGEVAAVAEAETPTPTPPLGTRHTHYATTIPAHPPTTPARVENQGAPVFRSAYKSEPIEGLDAPDEFQFMGLDPLIGQALHAMGYESPTAIQRRAVPDSMERRDIVGLAQTGTGKTLAFLLPSLHYMLKNPIQGHRPRLLVLTPTRELALQVATEAEYLATHTDFVIAAIYGQEDMKRQIRLLRDGVDVVVATPGRLLDHLQRGTIRLNNVETVVLDEADRMLDMGFLPDVRKILNRVPGARQTMMFSATMPQAVQSLSLDFQREPVLIEVARQLPPSQIDQKLYPVERHLKVPLLEHLMKQDLGMRSVMIFTETKSEADIVHRKLTELGFDPAIMHGDISQRERERALEQLRSGKVRMLVATNVAARGLDIQDVTHVINYEVPQTVDDYVHRIGRTARGEGTEGTAMTFMSSGDDGMIKRIESALERTLPRVYAEGFNYDVPTPSWAKPSADDIAASLTKPKNLAERFGRMMRRR